MLAWEVGCGIIGDDGQEKSRLMLTFNNLCAYAADSEIWPDYWLLLATPE
jgi:hypothetical protein